MLGRLKAPSPTLCISDALPTQPSIPVPPPPAAGEAHRSAEHGCDLRRGPRVDSRDLVPPSWRPRLDCPALRPALRPRDTATAPASAYSRPVEQDRRRGVPRTLPVRLSHRPRERPPRSEGRPLPAPSPLGRREVR